MYTYSQFAVDGNFILLRPLFITLFVFIALLFICLLLPGRIRRLINGLTTIITSVFVLVFGSLLLFFDAILIDELGLASDSVNTYFYIGTVILAILNPILFFSRKKKARQADEEALQEVR